MPPAKMPRPSAETIQNFVAGLEASLDRAAAAAPNPGKPSPHRLNRVEYTNAIHDLLALEVDGRSMLPPDDSGYGFDNIGSVLSLTPGLLEKICWRRTKSDVWPWAIRRSIPPRNHTGF